VGVAQGQSAPYQLKMGGGLSPLEMYHSRAFNLRANKAGKFCYWLIVELICPIKKALKIQGFLIKK